MRGENDGPAKGFAPASTLAAPTGWALRDPPGERAHRRVLIIEDNVDAADTLREILQFREHVAHVAHDGPEGLAEARVFMPDIVLCDIGLPGMDGYAVARAIRADPALAHVALVALTGYAEPEDAARARDAGFDAHLVKPPDIRALLQLVESVHSERRGAP